jgi:hypothetical protein
LSKLAAGVPDVGQLVIWDGQFLDVAATTLRRACEGAFDRIAPAYLYDAFDALERNGEKDRGPLVMSLLLHSVQETFRSFV